jgi:autotransporter-associated beta strand protein
VNASTSYGTPASYTAQGGSANLSAQYLPSGSNTPVTLTPTENGLFTVNYGGSSASFAITPVSAQLSSSGRLAAGGYNLSASSQSLSGNLINSMTVAGGLTVNPLVIQAGNVGIASLTKVYDGNTSIPVSGLTIDTSNSSIIAGDSVVVRATGAFNDPNVGASKAININLSLGGQDARNYYLSSTSTTGNYGEITQLPSVTYIGAAGGNWSNANNWYGGALPTGNNVATVIINAGSTVVYDSALVGQVGSTIQNNGTLAFTSPNNFNLSSIISGAGTIAQSGAGTLVISGNNTNFAGQLTIQSGSSVYLGSNNALGFNSATGQATTRVISNGGSLGLIDGVTLPSLSVAGSSAGAIGSVTLLSDIRTNNTQTYKANIVLAPVSTAISGIALDGMSTASSTLALAGSPANTPIATNIQPTVSLTSALGSVELYGTVNGSQNAQISTNGSVALQGQSLTVNAPNGIVIIGDSVGVTTHIYDFTVAANTIKILADVLTVHAQSYTGASYIGDAGDLPGGVAVLGALQTPQFQNLFNYSAGGVSSSVSTSNGSNLYVRTLVSMDPLIAFTGSIDDTVAGRHTLLLGAVADEAAAANNPPTVDLSSAAIGQISRPYSFNVQTLVVNNANIPVGSGTASAPVSSVTVADSTIRSVAGVNNTVGQGAPPVPPTPAIPPVVSAPVEPAITQAPILVSKPIESISPSTIAAPLGASGAGFGSGTLMASLRDYVNNSFNELGSISGSSVQVVMSDSVINQASDCKSSAMEEGECSAKK